MLPMTLLDHQHYPMNGKETLGLYYFMIQFQQTLISQEQKTMSFIHAVALLNAGGEVEFFVALRILADASSVSKHSTFHGGNVLLQISKPLVKVKQTFKTDVVLLNKLSSQDAE